MDRSIVSAIAMYRIMFGFPLTREAPIENNLDGLDDQVPT
jgi:hypothetical protein